MTDIMEEGYNKEINLYSRDISSHYHYPASPYILPPDHRKHDNSQHIWSFAYHRKAVKNVNPLAYCQIDLSLCSPYLKLFSSKIDFILQKSSLL